MILIFDLDDTLYDEITYVKSGLKQVAEYVDISYKIDAQTAYDIMYHELTINGRGKIFDVLLDKFDLLSNVNVRKCLSVYRTHIPDIVLNTDAVCCLNRCKDFHKYIVTDGNKIVQKNKIRALGLSARMKKVFITHNYGVKNAKPSSFCFERIAELENTEPANILYVGDNPNKDFINIKKLGFKTVRIRQGMFKDLQLDDEHEADFTINTLNELTLNLIYKLNGSR